MTENTMDYPVRKSSRTARRSTGTWRRLLTNPVSTTCLAILAVIVLVSVFAPLLTSQDANHSSVADVLAPMGHGHLLGTDSAGRDVFARLVYAGRFSLAGALIALTTAALVGITSGLIAGYFGGWFDSASNWTASLVMAMPAIVILLAVRAVMGPSLWTIMALLGVLLSPAFYRLVYAAVRGVRNELYVDAARVSGLSDVRIIGRHIFVVVRAPIIIQGAMILGISIGIQAGLDFLGLGDTTVPTWGSMLNDGFANIYTNPLLLLWPSIMVVVTCVSLTLFANVLRDELQGTNAPVGAAGPVAGASSDTTASAVASIARHDDDKGDGRAPLLTVRGLTIGYPQDDGTDKIVVRGVSLEVRRGEIHGLVGESGSGKTQTAWALLGLLGHGGKIVSGSIDFDGIELTALSDKAMGKIRGRQIAYVPQEPMSNLDPSFTIGHQLVEPLRDCMGLSAQAAQQRALELLAKVGIRDPQRTFNSYPHQISGGMAQRVLIAGAISCEPELLIADEPTTALDVTVQAEILDLLRKLQAELHMEVLLVTHDLGVVADLCDRVSVMRDGRVIEVGTVRDIFQRPLDPYTKKLVAVDHQYQKARGPLAERIVGPDRTETLS